MTGRRSEPLTGYGPISEFNIRKATTTTRTITSKKIAGRSCCSQFPYRLLKYRRVHALQNKSSDALPDITGWSDGVNFTSQSGMHALATSHSSHLGGGGRGRWRGDIPQCRHFWFLVMVDRDPDWRQEGCNTDTGLLQTLAERSYSTSILQATAYIRLHLCV